MDLSWLQKIEHDDLFEHLCAINIDHKPPEKQHLGYVDKSRDNINITLPNADIDLVITQSISSLSSSVQSSSTGFICWQTATKFADWVISNKLCPFMKAMSSSNVLELGAGSAAVLASTLGPRVKHYIASDQKHLLRLMKANFLHNVVSKRYTSSTCEFEHPPRNKKGELSKIDLIELDWENPDPGIHDYQELTGSLYPDVILACDTVYNDFLIPYFLSAMKRMMSAASIAIVAMQLREESILESFLETAFAESLHVYVIPDEHLSRDLIEGFVVYLFTRE